LIKFRKFWQRNPVGKIHNTKKQKDTNISDDDLKVYIKCPNPKCANGYEKNIRQISVSGGIEEHNVRICPVCDGLGEVDSGKRY